MSGTNSIPASTVGTAPETPSLDVTSINHSEALNLVRLALQKYPDFTSEVSKVLSAVESRKRLEAIKARRESIQQWYSRLSDKFRDEFERWEYYEPTPVWDEEEDGWENYPGSEYMDDEYDGVDEVLLEKVIRTISKSVKKKTGDGTFEIAFKTLLEIMTDLKSDCENAREDHDFPVNWEDLIYAATEATAKMALLWITKEGKVNKKIQTHVWALLDLPLYRCVDWDDFKVDLEGRIEDRMMGDREQNQLKRKRIVE
jgi:hypothetical protein